MPKAINTIDTNAHMARMSNRGIAQYRTADLIEEIRNAIGLKLSIISPNGSGILFATE